MSICCLCNAGCIMKKIEINRVWTNTVSRTNKLARLLRPVRAAGWSSAPRCDGGVHAEGRVQEYRGEVMVVAASSLPVLLPKTGAVGQGRQHVASTAMQPSSAMAVQQHDLVSYQVILGTVWKKAAQDLEDSKMETSFAPWSLWVLCVHLAFGSADFSAAINSQEH